MRPAKYQIYEEIKCNLCGSDIYKIKYKPTNKAFNPEEIFSASGGIRGTQQIVECKNCGLVYVNPRVKQDVVVKAYANAVDELYVSQEEGRSATFKKALKLVERYAPGKGTILDIGSAAGFFLNVAREAGWKTYGVEPSKWMTEWGNKKFNVNIINGVLGETKFKKGFFDAVTMWDVLEHTPDPMAELKEVNRILKDRGILVINFPDIGSLLAKIAGSRWWFILSVHLFHFDRKTMKAILEKNGFEVVKFSRHFQTLNLEHLCKMAGLYSSFLSKVGLAMVNLLRINNLKIPYYASQANVIAKKVRGL